MPPIISVEKLTKTYASGFEALKGIDLEIQRGEIFALLGPNGAGKTTLIGIICGIVNATSGRSSPTAMTSSKTTARQGARSGWFHRSYVPCLSRCRRSRRWSRW
jgi:ABC-type multidrug transport system ATPase subunit